MRFNQQFERISERLSRSALNRIDERAQPHIGGMMPPTPTVMRVAVRVPSSPRTAGM